MHIGGEALQQWLEGDIASVKCKRSRPASAQVEAGCSNNMQLQPPPPTVLDQILNLYSYICLEVLHNHVCCTLQCVSMNDVEAAACVKFFVKRSFVCTEHYSMLTQLEVPKLKQRFYKVPIGQIDLEQIHSS